MVQGQLVLKGGGLALFLLNFFKVYHFYVWKLPYKVIISCSTQPTSAADISQHLVRLAASDDFVICRNALGQVVVLPSRRLLCPAADDNFVKLLYSWQNCVMHFEKKLFFSATIVL